VCVILAASVIGCGTGSTVLIDDSPPMAARTPFNVMPVPTFELKPISEGGGGGGGGGGSDVVLETLCNMLLDWKEGVSAQQWCKQNYSRCRLCVLPPS